VNESSSTGLSISFAGIEGRRAAAWSKDALSIDYTNFNQCVAARQGHKREAVYQRSGTHFTSCGSQRSRDGRSAIAQIAGN